MNNQKEKVIVHIDGYMFDVTKYLSKHPGGKSILKKYNGKDATSIFNSVHGHCDSYVDSLLEEFCIGKVENTSSQKNVNKIYNQITEHH